MAKLDMDETIREDVTSKAAAAKNIRLRLTIYLPVMIAIFMLIAASLVLYLNPNIFLSSDIPISVYHQSITGWIYLMTAFGLIAGVVMA